jgi:hypothetical protein
VVRNIGRLATDVVELQTLKDAENLLIEQCIEPTVIASLALF